jgi:hypothetical protein
MNFQNQNTSDFDLFVWMFVFEGEKINRNR